MSTSQCVQAQRDSDAYRDGADANGEPYTVRWEVTVYAYSHEDAARIARGIQLTPNNDCVTFEVQSEIYSPGGRWVRVEVEDDEE